MRDNPKHPYYDNENEISDILNNTTLKILGEYRTNNDAFAIKKWNTEIWKTICEETNGIQKRRIPKT